MCSSASFVARLPTPIKVEAPAEKDKSKKKKKVPVAKTVAKASETTIGSAASGNDTVETVGGRLWEKQPVVRTH